MYRPMQKGEEGWDTMLTAGKDPREDLLEYRNKRKFSIQESKEDPGRFDQEQEILTLTLHRDDPGWDYMLTESQPAWGGLPGFKPPRPKVKFVPVGRKKAPRRKAPGVHAMTHSSGPTLQDEKSKEPKTTTPFPKNATFALKESQELPSSIQERQIQVAAVEDPKNVTPSPKKATIVPQESKQVQVKQERQEFTFTDEWFPIQYCPNVFLAQCASYLGIQEDDVRAVVDAVPQDSGSPLVKRVCNALCKNKEGSDHDDEAMFLEAEFPKFQGINPITKRPFLFDLLICAQEMQRSLEFKFPEELERVTKKKIYERDFQIIFKADITARMRSHKIRICAFVPLTIGGNKVLGWNPATGKGICYKDKTKVEEAIRELGNKKTEDFVESMMEYGRQTFGDNTSIRKSCILSASIHSSLKQLVNANSNKYAHLFSARHVLQEMKRGFKFTREEHLDLMQGRCWETSICYDRLVYGHKEQCYLTELHRSKHYVSKHQQKYGFRGNDGVRYYENGTLESPVEADY